MLLAFFIFVNNKKIILILCLYSAFACLLLTCRNLNRGFSFSDKIGDIFYFYISVSAETSVGDLHPRLLPVTHFLDCCVLFAETMVAELQQATYAVVTKPWKEKGN